MNATASCLRSITNLRQSWRHGIYEHKSHEREKKHNCAIHPEARTLAAFECTRDNVPGLLLPTEVNRNLLAGAYAKKLPIYATQNVHAAGLSDTVYAHQPRFLRFAEEGGLPFKALASFGRAEHAQRLDLVEKLVQTVWPPARLEGVEQ